MAKGNEYMVNRISVNVTGGDELRFWRLEGREAISEHFVWTLTLLSENTQINRSKLLGQPVTITIPTQNAIVPRYLNGKITSVGAMPIEHDGTRYAAYTLTVESDFWPMKRNRDMRIFQGKTVPEIIKEMVSEHNVNMDDKLTENYRIWEYCVQYQESSLDFINRLMEQEGIAFHFRHDIDSHTLVLTDSGTELQSFSGYEVIPYHQTPSGGVTGEEGISQWFVQDNITPGLYSLDDYDFRKPNAWLFQARQNGVAPQPGTVSVYDWPGRYVDHSHGDRYARIHQERWQVEHQQTSGTSNASALVPGHTFRLKNAPFSAHNSSYLITNATYHFEENPYSTSDNSNSTQRTDFIVIPAVTPYRPEQITPWPRTYGPQTAKVVGPTGESIWTDRYGRVKVKFHWDRQAKGDDTSSCWIRVSSAWAGQGFGGVQIPRIGDEVVVDFINGDPDRPIITGRVYNKSSMPPWELPAAATVMGFMTRSKDGNNDNGSHLLFEDKAGSEKVALHAEKDMNISVENNQSVEIDGSRTTTIKGEQKDDVTSAATFHYRAAHTTTVEGEETSVFNNTQTETIKNGRKLDITSGGDKVTVKGERNTDIDGTEIHHVTEKLTENYDSGQVTTIKNGGRKDTIDGGVTIDVNSGDWTQNVKKGTIYIYSPKTITIKSDKEIDLDAPNINSKASLHKESFTGNSLSFTGASESITGISVSRTYASLSHANFSVSHNTFGYSNTPMKFEQVQTLINSGALSLYSKALTLFL